MSAPAKKLHGDERGAVMVIGLFMATFLIGASWFVFGMARTLVFRERVQEAADAAAFSSAAIHAKGMNLIAAINLLFFALTALWMLLRTFEHAMYLLQTTVTFNSTNCHGFGCEVKTCAVSPLSAAMTAADLGGPAAACRVAHGLQSTRDVNKNARQTIGDRMWEIFPKLSKVQDVTARLAPAAGTAASLALGVKYQHFTIAFSTSLLPGEDLARLASKMETESDKKKPAKPAKPATVDQTPLQRPAKLGPPSPPTDDGDIDQQDEKAKITAEEKAANKDAAVAKPLGLPVVSKKFGSLCGRAAKVSLNKFRSVLGAIPGLGTLLDLPVIKQAIDGAVNLSTSYLQSEFCSDSDWAGHGKNTKLFRLRGPKLMLGHAENGNDLMQIWAFTHGELTDKDHPRVAMGARAHAKPTKTSNWYVAQAEFYFDCDAKWSAAKCNGDDNAMFNMKWRARLRRVRPPQLGAELGRYLRDALFSGPVKEALQKGLGLGAYEPKPGEEKLDIKERFTQQIIDDLFDNAFGKLKDAVTDGAGVGNGETGDLPKELLH